MDANVMMEMEQHLLFYKAMADNEVELARINRYLDMIKEEGSGEKLSNEVDESVRAVFSLVLEKGLDPWAIDLEEFVRMYSQKVSSNEFDMLVAGRLLLMAWKILNLQSQETRMNADTPEPEFEDIPMDDDFAFIDEDPVIVPEVPLTKAYAHVLPRPVTMMELADAFAEAEQEMDIWKAREEARTKLNQRKPRAKFDNKAHKEDDENVVESVYQRIYSMGMDPMPITEFYTGSKEDNISVFVSVLHLVRNGRLEISQEVLPYGEIMVQIKLPEASIPLEIAAVN